MGRMGGVGCSSRDSNLEKSPHSHGQGCVGAEFLKRINRRTRQVAIVQLDRFP